MNPKFLYGYAPLVLIDYWIQCAHVPMAVRLGWVKPRV